MSAPGPALDGLCAAAASALAAHRADSVDRRWSCRDAALRPKWGARHRDPTGVTPSGSSVEADVTGFDRWLRRWDRRRGR